MKGNQEWVRKKLEELESCSKRPAKSFTRFQYEQWFNISAKLAGKRLREYVIAGKIQRGGSGTATYYTIVEAKSEQQSFTGAKRSSRTTAL